ncbi:hypothetical protein GE061_013913 [Apolygus lucorum]|uniref:Uncharacterized protein n=1 Tax=Apolygus lucorum TaxID=248454 RepID=A0A6A4KCH8_APOLU|nr:hypothetical protein GE061_013913 [Apolygus lucorum]
MAVKGPAHEYFKVQRGNIVRVDWSYDASWKFYPLSALQVAYIAGVISNFINKLLFIKAFELQRLHLIGHSLGAHVMGITGSYLDEGRPARITGLDPAKPGFEGTVSESYRLDKTDGHFVDVIHSAAGAAGFVSAIGHVDFYPNGGSPPQPGCFDITAPWQLIGCSHGRAYDYFTESISTPQGFPAVECDSWSNFESGACDKNKQIFMGPNTPTTARGVYYLSTNGGSPYAKSSIH